MASAAQILANQANAQKSTGPQTPEGRAKSAANSTKHGLSSAFRVLPHEDQDEFDTLLAILREEHKPATEHQRFLVDQLAKTQWTLARAQRLETRAFEHLAGFLEADPSDADAIIIAAMFKTNPNALATIQRYGAQSQNAYHKISRELKASKEIQNEAKCAGATAKPAVRSMSAPAPVNPAPPTDSKRSQSSFIPPSPERTQSIQEARI